MATPRRPGTVNSTTDSDGSTIASIFPGDWTLSLDSEDSV